MAEPVKYWPKVLLVLSLLPFIASFVFFDDQDLAGIQILLMAPVIYAIWEIGRYDVLNLRGERDEHVSELGNRIAYYLSMFLVGGILMGGLVYWFLKVTA